MRYKYENPLDEKQGANYLSDQTQYMRYMTQFEVLKEMGIDKEFVDNNKHLLLDLNKFLPLSNITNPRLLKLFRLRRSLAVLEKDAGLIQDADETILANLADYQTTRGDDGFFTKSLSTERKIWEEKNKEEKRMGFMQNLFKKKQVEQKEQFAGE